MNKNYQISENKNEAEQKINNNNSGLSPCTQKYQKDRPPYIEEDKDEKGLHRKERTW